jgi:glycerol-3-phosphate dehydrogenase subunit B
LIASEKYCDLMVIGSGMAGMAASLFAANRGISTMVIGNTGSMRFFSGLIDLMSVYPVSTGRIWEDPWEAIHFLSKNHEYPHPYSRIKPDMIKRAMNEFLSFLSESDLGYHTNENRNQTVITSAGTCKQTFGVPRTMVAGVTAFQEKTPCLLVGFPELKGFSSHQIKESIKGRWPSLRSVALPFPNHFHELFPEQLAHELENESCREKLAKLILPHLNDAVSIGMPAILGIHNSGDIHGDLEKRLGMPLFEIPTLPPSIPGLRLKMIFQHQL